MSQLNRDLKLVNEIGQSFHELSAAAVVLWPVIQIEQQCLNLTESVAGSHPEIVQAIDNEITGHP